MASDLSQLERRYLISCKRQGVQPNNSILSSFSKMKHRNFRCLEIPVDQLAYSDIPPLVNVFSSSKLSDIDAVDVCQKSSGLSLNEECLLSLLWAVNPKLRVVDLIDWAFWKNILQDICHRGLSCQVLSLRFSPIRNLNMAGKFMQLQSLNLDHSIHLTSFQVTCFSCMPKLVQLSMCATQVSNLWTTSAALSKLPSLVELRFQRFLCCHDTGPCPKSGCTVTSSYNKTHFGRQWRLPYPGLLSSASENIAFENLQYITGENPIDLLSDNDSYTSHLLLQTTHEKSSDESESEFKFSNRRLTVGDWDETLYDTIPEFDEHGDSRMSHASGSSMRTLGEFIKEVTYSGGGIKNVASGIDGLEDLSSNKVSGHTPLCELSDQFSLYNHSFVSEVLDDSDEGSSVNLLNSHNSTGTSEFVPENQILFHSSPICFEKFYREYMISSLAHLKVLDNLPVKDLERTKALRAIEKFYEYVPYNRHFRESVVSILQRREMGSGQGPYKHSRKGQPYSRESNHSYTRSLSAAKVCSSPWPCLYPISKFRSHSVDEFKTFRPRQFEYHPSDPSLMVFGTLNGELVVINHESQKLVGYLPSVGALPSILGLCWLKKYPSKLIAGSDNGSLQLYDISKMPPTVTDRHCSLDACMRAFDEFELLTSVHINSTDEHFLASGFSKNVALYDIGTGRRLQFLKDLHEDHINVVKFSHHSPTIFATASFDQNVKLWDLRQGTSRPCYTVSSSRGNVMVCFSPDDHYLLASAIDNEVKQLLAVDGRLHTVFDIAPIGTDQNFTRSYYMNGRDHVISGSCEENVVHICCARTGKRLRDISLQDTDSRYSMFVQSLRGDPFRPFHMSVLAAYLRPSTESEIIKVNMLTSNDCTEQVTPIPHGHASSSFGG